MTDKQISICLSVTRAPSRCTHALTISNPTPVGFTLSKTQRPGTTYRFGIKARFYIAMFRANLAPNRRRANRGRFMKAPLLLALASLNDTRIKEFGKRAEAIAPWRIHDIRRTVATGMADIGVQPHIIEAALNHIS